MKYKVRLQRGFGGFGFGVWLNGWPWLTICIGPFTWHVTRKTRKPERMCEFPRAMNGQCFVCGKFEDNDQAQFREERA